MSSTTEHPPEVSQALKLASLALRDYRQGTPFDLSAYSEIARKAINDLLTKGDK